MNMTELVPFLDTKLYIEDGKITTDLYRKPTDVPTSIILLLSTYLYITTCLIHLLTDLYDIAV